MLMRFMVGVACGESICYTIKDIHPGAQTKRRGGARPVRKLLGGMASPAAFLFPSNESPFRGEGFYRGLSRRDAANQPLVFNGGVSATHWWDLLTRHLSFGMVPPGNAQG
jgi:hypothetical protein